MMKQKAAEMKATAAATYQKTKNLLNLALTEVTEAPETALRFLVRRVLPVAKEVAELRGQLNKFVWIRFLRGAQFVYRSYSRFGREGLS